MKSSSKKYLLPLYNNGRQTSKIYCNDNCQKYLLFLSLVSILITVSILYKLESQNDTFRSVFMPVNNDHHHENLQNPHKIQLGIPSSLEETDKEEENININNTNNENKPIDINKQRQNKVKEMMILAWTGYKKYAWGANELKPIAKSSHSPSIFGSARNLGASIVDSLDTLFIMGLTDFYNEAKEWAVKNINLNINSDFSLFEVNIRFIGGFLSMHSLTNEQVFLDKAKEIADAVLPAFNSQTGIPYSIVNPASKSGHNYGWAAGSCSILAEIGTISLEFQYLSDHTGSSIYEDKIKKIYKALDDVEKKEGLYYNYINPNTGNWCGGQATMGGLSDSFYEYLLKYWLYKDRKDDHLLNTYKETMKVINEKLVAKSDSGLTFIGEYNGGLTRRMGHLACFSGGLYAMSSMYLNNLSKEEKDSYAKLAEEITNTCHESYIRTATHLGPESFRFDGGADATATGSDLYYILRPEVVESYFYLWRMTKNQKYRDWAWDAIEAIEKYCKTENGYSGISNVNSNSPPKDDVQQSFFLAETLKYLYLIFSDDDVIPLDKYVFNTEAHPLLIRNKK